MGLHTSTLGHLLVDPPLNAAEERFLRGFAETRRWDRPAGPYVVLDHPLQDDASDDHERYNRPSRHEPGLWCGWKPCLEGCCISLRSEVATEGELWLEYLIEHFLAPGGQAARRKGFAEFTFDHEINGVVFVEGAETRQVFAIECITNEVRGITLMPGVSMAQAWGIEDDEERLQRRLDLLARRRASLRR